MVSTVYGISLRKVDYDILGLDAQRSHFLLRERNRLGARSNKSGNASGVAHHIPGVVNIVEFTKQFNARTADQDGMIIPVVITVYADRSFSFITKTPPAAVLLKKACNIQSGSGVPNQTKG